MASADQISFRNLGRRSGRRPLRRTQSTTQASQRTAERLRRGHEERAGIDAKTIPKGGPPPRPPRQRLAKRKARKESLVKFGFCPMTSLFSTAYWVRKSNESPARVPAETASIEQDSLAPHPAARQGASRARNCAAISVFSFDGSTAVFFLGRQKENGGGLLRVTTRDHAPFGAAAPRHAGSSCPTEASQVVPSNGPTWSSAPTGALWGMPCKRYAVPGAWPVRCLTLPTGRGKFKR